MNTTNHINTSNSNPWKLLAPCCVLAAGCLWGIIGLFSNTLRGMGLDPVQITELRSLIAAAGHSDHHPAQRSLSFSDPPARSVDVPGNRHCQHRVLQHMLFSLHHPEHTVHRMHSALHRALLCYDPVLPYFS